MLTSIPDKDEMELGEMLVGKTKVATIHIPELSRVYSLKGSITGLRLEFNTPRKVGTEVVNLKGQSPQKTKLLLAEKKSKYNDTFWLHVDYGGVFTTSTESIYFPEHRRSLDILLTRRIVLDSTVITGERVVVLHSAFDCNKCDIYIIKPGEVMVERGVEVTYKDEIT